MLYLSLREGFYLNYVQKSVIYPKIKLRRLL